MLFDNQKDRAVRLSALQDDAILQAQANLPCSASATSRLQLQMRYSRFKTRQSLLRMSRSLFKP